TCLATFGLRHNPHSTGNAHARATDGSRASTHTTSHLCPNFTLLFLRLDRTGSRCDPLAQTWSPSLPSTVSSASSTIGSSAGRSATTCLTSTAARGQIEKRAEEYRRW